MATGKKGTEKKDATDKKQQLQVVTAPENAAVMQPGESVEGRIKTEIAKYNVADKKIKELQKAYAGLVVLPTPGHDATKEERKEFTESYELARAAVGVLRPLRTGIEKMRKDLNADYLAIKKGIDGEAERITEKLVAIEKPIKDQMDKADGELKAQREAAELAEKSKLHNRVNQLIESGIKLEGNFYCIGEISVDVVTIGQMPDEQFATLLDRVAQVNAKIKEDEAIEAQRKEDERKDFERRQKEQEEAQKSLDEERAKFDEERAEMKKKVVQFRKQSLESIRLQYTTKTNNFVYTTIAGTVEVSISDIENSDDARWNTILSNARSLSDEIFNAYQQHLANQKEKEDAEAKKKAVYESRISLLTGMGFSPAHEFMLHDAAKVSYTTISESDDIIWEQVIVSVKERIEKLGEKRALINARMQTLLNLGFVRNTNGFGMEGELSKRCWIINNSCFTTDVVEDWEETLAEAKDNATNIKAAETTALQVANNKKESQRIAALSDAEKIIEYITSLLDVPVPELSDNTKTDFEEFHRILQTHLAEYRQLAEK